MSTLTDKLPKLPTVKLPEVKVLDLDEAKKPLFAAFGVVDFAVAQVKDVPADFSAEAKKIQARVSAARTSVPAQLKTLPTQVKGFRSDVEGRVAKAQTQATSVYTKLAVRGEQFVTQIRRQPATEAAIAEGKAAVKKAEAAANSAKRATKAAEKAAEGAVTKLG